MGFHIFKAYNKTNHGNIGKDKTIKHKIFCSVIPGILFLNGHTKLGSKSGGTTE